jgi:uncharacterized protein (DUF58 family)
MSDNTGSPVPFDGPGDGPFDAAFLRSLSQLAFAVRRQRAVEGEGLVRRDRRGGAVEFADHRPFASGDDPRFVDWSAYARTGRFFVKEFEREDDLSLLVVLDTSASMGLHGKLRAAQRIAYALSYLGLSGGSRVRVAAATEGSLRLSPEVSGTPRLRELAAFLSGLRAAGETATGESLMSVPGAARGSRVLVLLSDLLGSRTTGDALQRVLGARIRRGDDVHVVQLHAQADVRSPLSGSGVVVDAETGERVVIDQTAGRRLVDDASRRERRWRRFAARHRASYVPVDAGVPTEEAVLRWLRSGGVVA